MLAHALALHPSATRAAPAAFLLAGSDSSRHTWRAGALVPSHHSMLAFLSKYPRWLPARTETINQLLPRPSTALCSRSLDFFERPRFGNSTMA
eukprot:6329494-Prymnesium_polylepis.1